MPCCQPQGAARSWCSLVKTMLREAEEGWEKKNKNVLVYTRSKVT